jgi:hypothetical protein
LAPSFNGFRAMIWYELLKFPPFSPAPVKTNPFEISQAGNSKLHEPDGHFLHPNNQNGAVPRRRQGYGR